MSFLVPGKKLSNLPGFPGKDLLLAAQKRGIELTGGAVKLDAVSVMLIGLANILVERGIVGDE